jgi:hypothetical protein
VAIRIDLTPGSTHIPVEKCVEGMRRVSTFSAIASTHTTLQSANRNYLPSCAHELANLRLYTRYGLISILVTSIDEHGSSRFLQHPPSVSLLPQPRSSTQKPPSSS